MKKLHVRKGDNVKIICGKDKGNTGKISAVNPDSGRVVVENSNIMIKHVKAKSAQQQSSIQKISGSIDASNVQILCPSCGKPTRVCGKAIEVKGKTKWQRTCKKCGATLDVKAAKPAEKKAKKKKDEEIADEETADTKGGDGITEKNEDGAIV